MELRSAVHIALHLSPARKAPRSFSHGKGVETTQKIRLKASFVGMAQGAQSQASLHRQDFHRVGEYSVVRISAKAGDSAGGAYASADGGQTCDNKQAGRGGPVQWLRDIFLRRSAQKEEVVTSLKRYGVAGILSYGLLNTAYYLTTFLFVWFYVAPSPGGLGFVPAAKRFLQVFATVWAGSQVTKLLRAAGALSLAPFVDKGLTWYTQRFNFESRGKAFSFLVIACFGLAALVFLIITTLWS